MTRIRMRISILLCVSSVFFISNCGLPQFAFLAPPTSVRIIDQAPPIIEFFHDQANNNNNFRGYDIYYKFYNNQTNSEGCVKDKEEITKMPINLTPDRLRARRYRQIIVYNDSSFSTGILLSIDDKARRNCMRIVIPDQKQLDNNATIEVNTIGVNTSVCASSNNTIYRMYRNVTNSFSSDVGQCTLAVNVNSRCKPFDVDSGVQLSTIFSASDGDLTGIDSANNPLATFNAGDLYVAFYGIARGIDITSNSFRIIYSEPTFLGYIPVNSQGNASAQQCNEGL